MAQILERYVLHCACPVFSIGMGVGPNEGSKGEREGGREERAEVVSRTAHERSTVSPDMG